MNLFTRVFCYTTCFILFAYIHNCYASPFVGTITRLKGNATMLPPGEVEAVEVKLKDKIKEDTSILTADKSFVQVTLKNKVKMNLGPKSKMVVNLCGPTKAGMVSLLVGKMRAKVEEKRKRKETKLLIKTKSAALGVRGTEFQVTYNNKNELSSVLTFEGEVAMARIEPKKVVKKKAVLKAEDLNKILNKKKDVVQVQKGGYSAVSKNLEKATVPVRISPVQFTRLKINKELLPEKKISKEEFQAEFKKTKEDFTQIAKTEKKKKIKANGTYDIKTGQYKPKAGGYVDLETGIYVPPAKRSVLDKKLNLFIDKDAPKSVAEDGSYVPPEGTVLDATKGFVAKDPEEDVEVVELNKRISGQIVKPSKPSDDDLEDLEEDAYQKYFKIE